VLTQTEENYIKEIFKLSEKQEGYISTNAIADAKQTTAASVTDMVKKLAAKGYVDYVIYTGSKLTDNGNEIAKTIVRRHRLWEVFLVKKLNFSWDEVHYLAEQLEHVQSEALTERLDHFLDYPKVDPHGDPIPDSTGHIDYINTQKLNELKNNDEAVLLGVSDHSSEFLHYLDRVNITLGSKVKIIEIYSFDESIHILLNDSKDLIVSKQIAKHLYVKVEE